MTQNIIYILAKRQNMPIYRRFKKAKKSGNQKVLENLSKTHLFKLRLYFGDFTIKSFGIKYCFATGTFVSIAL